MKQTTAAFALALVLAGCVTMPPGGASAPSGATRIPAAPLDLGDWRRLSASANLQNFERQVADRYGAGLTLAAVSADLRRYDFNCAASRQAEGRGDPPDQICRKTVTAENCTHTWQVHLFDGGGNEILARSRALYDRRCGGDGLLGGPS